MSRLEKAWKIKARKTRRFSNGVYLEIGWHHGMKRLYAEVYWTTGPYNTGNVKQAYFLSHTNTELMSRVRLTLSKGPENIGWEKDMMEKITEGRWANFGMGSSERRRKHARGESCYGRRVCRLRACARQI